MNKGEMFGLGFVAGIIIISNFFLTMDVLFNHSYKLHQLLLLLGCITIMNYFTRNIYVNVKREIELDANVGLDVNHARDAK